MKITLTANMDDHTRYKFEHLLELAGIGQPCGELGEEVEIDIPGAWYIYDFANECRLSGIRFTVVDGRVYAHDCDIPALLIQQAC